MIAAERSLALEPITVFVLLPNFCTFINFIKNNELL